MSSVMLQVRNVPADVHARLKSRAALSGLSLSDYVLRELRKLSQVPTPEELSARVRQRASAFGRVRESGSKAVLAGRAGR